MYNTNTDNTYKQHFVHIVHIVHIATVDVGQDYVLRKSGE